MDDNEHYHDPKLEVATQLFTDAMDRQADDIRAHEDGVRQLAVQCWRDADVFMEMRDFA